MLKVKNITKKFDKVLALDNVNLSVTPGTITSIIGPSGSGKTTLLRTIGMLELADSGSILIDKESYKFPLASIEGREPWPNVSVVFQQLFLWPHLNLRENVELPLKLRGSLDKNSEHLEMLYKLFEMQEFIERFPNQVSLGQRQRVALVRALALQPKYLLLDEITSSLDVEQSEIILSHLESIKKLGVGIIMVAHDINFALSNADEVLFIESGKIIKQGKPYEFLLEFENKRIASFINSASLGSDNVKMYSGQEEFQAYHLALLERLPINSTITVIGSLGSKWYCPMGDKYKEYDSMRVAKKIVWNVLMYEYDVEEKRLVKEHPEVSNFFTLAEGVKNWANININSDGTVILQIFEPNPLIIEIKNATLADSYMRYYNDLLKHSNKFTG